MISDLFRHEHPDKRSNREWLQTLSKKVAFVANVEKAICKVCGKEFAKKSSTNITCGPRCAHLNRKAQVRAWQLENYEYKRIITKKCVICDKDFKPLNNRIKACGPVCSDEYRRTKRKANEIRTRTNSLEGHNH